MPRGESLYHQYPDYRVDLAPHPRPVRVRFAGETVASSERALTVLETKHDPVVYLPREDVRLELFERTDHETFCPFKGYASYWSLRVGDASLPNVMWSYEDPFEQVAGLKDYVAFYTTRVELEED